MKVKIIAIPVELRRGERKFALNIPELAMVRALTFATRPALVMSAGQASYEPLPVVHVELDPDDEKVRRAFVLLAIGDEVAPSEGVALRWCVSGTGTTPDGAPLIGHVLELVQLETHQVVH